MHNSAHFRFKFGVVQFKGLCVWIGRFDTHRDYGAVEMKYVTHHHHATCGCLPCFSVSIKAFIDITHTHLISRVRALEKADRVKLVV